VAIEGKPLNLMKRRRVVQGDFVFAIKCFLWGVVYIYVEEVGKNGEPPYSRGYNAIRPLQIFVFTLKFILCLH
jgi:hypothetical protein